jgi:hypothetical protein
MRYQDIHCIRNKAVGRIHVLCARVCGPMILKVFRGTYGIFKSFIETEKQSERCAIVVDDM